MSLYYKRKTFGTFNLYIGPSFLFLRAYVKSVVKNLKEESNLMLADLFEKVRADLASQSVSSPVEFSLTPSPLPICVNPEDMQAGQ